MTVVFWKTGKMFLISKLCIARELARRIRKQIVALEGKCNIEKYNLLFNGEVGIGKSTAICHLTGLIDGDCLKKGEETDRLPLLKTGSGRTTVCETRIIPTGCIYGKLLDRRQ